MNVREFPKIASNVLIKAERYLVLKSRFFIFHKNSHVKSSGGELCFRRCFSILICFLQ